MKTITKILGAAFCLVLLMSQPAAAEVSTFTDPAFPGKVAFCVSYGKLLANDPPSAAIIVLGKVFDTPKDTVGIPMIGFLIQESGITNIKQYAELFIDGKEFPLETSEQSYPDLPAVRIGFPFTDEAYQALMQTDKPVLLRFHCNYHRPIHREVLIPAATIAEAQMVYRTYTNPQVAP